MLTLKREDPAPVQDRAELQTLIGRGCVFEGKLTFEGMVRIDGQFKGQIQTKDTLVISAGALVQADIVAGTVVVYGTVEGNITASALVELHQPARMRGNLETPSLAIAKGVLFEGSCKMGGSPSAATTPGGDKPAPPPLPGARRDAA